VNSQADEQSQGGADQGYGHCLRCGQLLQLMGIEAFRVGGTTGGWKMLFGEFAELGEGMLDLEVFACPYCRKVELRVPVQ